MTMRNTIAWKQKAHQSGQISALSRINVRRLFLEIEEKLDDLKQGVEEKQDVEEKLDDLKQIVSLLASEIRKTSFATS